jgi:hypothetical protein
VEPDDTSLNWIGHAVAVGTPPIGVFVAVRVGVRVAVPVAVLVRVGVGVLILPPRTQKAWSWLV